MCAIGKATGCRCSTKRENFSAISGSVERPDPGELRAAWTSGREFHPRTYYGDRFAGQRLRRRDGLGQASSEIQGGFKMTAKQTRRGILRSAGGLVAAASVRSALRAEELVSPV